MRLRIGVPRTAFVEREYAFRVLLGEMLGLEFDVVTGDVAETTIEVPGSPQRIVIGEGFFALAAGDWLGASTQPSRPLPRLRVPAELDVPAFVPADVVAPYGAVAGVAQAVEILADGLRIGFDLPGSAFFLLTRYEEAVPGRRDVHDRFPADASVLHAEGVLDRPLVDEYVELLFACLRRCWPDIRRRARDYRFIVSHDVDSPLFFLGCTPKRLLGALAGDVARRRDPGLALRRLRGAMTAMPARFERDPHNTFDFLMDASEKRGLRSAFYFITGGDAARDADYTMDHPWIRALVRRIGERGHEVGLHPSYATYLDPAETAAQFRTLTDTAAACGIRQDAWGGRQHYLRWRAGTTWANWDAAGLDYDSSVCFADVAGFRAGTCHEYPAYDVVGRRALALRERPLVLMETTLIAPQYMNLPPSRRLDVVRSLAATCRAYRGDMTLLWHNSKVVSQAERREYLSALDIGVAATAGTQ